MAKFEYRTDQVEIVRQTSGKAGRREVATGDVTGLSMHIADMCDIMNKGGFEVIDITSVIAPSGSDSLSRASITKGVIVTGRKPAKK